MSPRRWPLLRFVDTKIGHGAGKDGGWGGRRRRGEDKGGYWGLRIEGLGMCGHRLRYVMILGTDFADYAER